MRRTSSGKIIQFRAYLLRKQRTAADVDKARFTWETLKRKNLEKLQPDGRPKC